MPGELKEMIIRPTVLCAGLFLMVCSTLIQAHQFTDGTHQHVWRKTTYGKDYRPGHSVSGPTGGITIWSPADINEYGANNSVRFARPTPINQQSAKQSTKQAQIQSGTLPANQPQSNTPVIKSMAPSRYGKVHKRDYGK